MKFILDILFTCSQNIMIVDRYSEFKCSVIEEL